MKLVVLHTAQFEVPNDCSLKDAIIFLAQLKFENIDNFDFGKEAIFCTADYYGKEDMIAPTIKAPPYYIHYLKIKDMNFIEKASHNATLLNELCKRNGCER